jgi:hypothetical protein
MNENAPSITSGRGSYSPTPVDASRQRHGLVFILFAIWILSIPFQRYSLVKTYSVDNLLAPLLCLVALFLPRLRNPYVVSRRIKTMLVVVGLYGLFWMASLFPVFSLNPVLLQRSWLGLRDAFYLFPVLFFVRDRYSFRMLKSLLIIVTMMAAVSALLGSLGWIQLPVERYESSRIDIAWLPKAIGLLSNYGDVAMLYGFTAVLMVSHSREELAFGLSARGGKWLVWLSLLAGVLGSQSRNLVLTVLLALGAYRVFRALSNAQASTRIAVAGILIAIVISVTAVLGTFGGDIAEAMGHWGGTNAAETADWRLHTYGQALTLIGQNPFTGITSDMYGKWGYLAEVLHNMWLRVLLQGGVLRFFALVGLFWLAAKSGYINLGAEGERAHNAALVLASLIAMLLATQFYPGESDIMWVMLGALVSFSWVSRDMPQTKTS